MKLIIDHLTHKYNTNSKTDVKALDDINLVINSGDFIALIGHTGSGKSTLVQHLNGLLKPTSGTIYFDGEDIFEKGYNLKKLRAKVGLVFQYPEHQLFADTVFDDVCFGPLNMGLSKKDAELKAYEALKKVGIDEIYFNQSPLDMSGGQKRRVAIAGVLAMKPEILILDEPTAGLDPRGRDDLLDQIKSLHDNNDMTIVLVSHNMDDVAKYVSRMIVMNKGKVCMDDAPANLFPQYQRLEEIGLRAPHVTYLMNRLKENGFDVSTDVITKEGAVEAIIEAFNRSIQ